MKLALLCDTHFGCRNDSLFFLEKTEKFFNEVFFPYVNRNDIDAIIHLGDVFDRRKHVQFNTLERSKRFFLEPLRAFAATGRAVHLLLGNHDLFYNDRLDSSGFMTLLEAYPEFNLHVTPKHMKFGSMFVDFLPWVYEANREETNAFLREQRYADCAMSHLELCGFFNNDGAESRTGLNQAQLEHYPIVFSGHYHIRGVAGNIQFLGNPLQTIWGDYESLKGFAVLDTETKAVSWINNTDQSFVKVVYDEGECERIGFENIEIPEIKSKYVKLIVTGVIKNMYLFNKFSERVNKCEPIDLKVVMPSNLDQLMAQEDVEEPNEEEVKAKMMALTAKNPLQLLSGYVDSDGHFTHPERTKALLADLYRERGDLD